MICETTVRDPGLPRAPQPCVETAGGSRHHGAMADSSVPGGDTPAGTGHRRVYRSTPGTPSPASWSAKCGQLARTVYVGLRDGGLDPEAAFDLACVLMDRGDVQPGRARAG